MDKENYTPNERTKVGFPEARHEDNKKGRKTLTSLILLAIAFLLAFGAWYFFSRREETIEFKNENPAEEVTQVPTEEPTPAKVGKADVKIQVLNGTGVPGDAGKLKDKLNELGYANIDTENAESYTNKSAQVGYSSDLSEIVKEEVGETLSSMYTQVSSIGNSTSEYDIVIVTGALKTAAKTTATITPTSKLSITPSVTAKLTVTPTP